MGPENKNKQGAENRDSFVWSPDKHQLSVTTDILCTKMSRRKVPRKNRT